MDTQEEAELRTRIRDLEDLLGQNDGKLYTAFQLPPALSNLMGLLLAVPTVTQHMIRKNLGLKPKQTMFRLRKHLKHWDIEIHSRRGVGYWIEDHDKTRIRNFITGKAANF